MDGASVYLKCMDLIRLVNSASNYKRVLSRAARTVPVVPSGPGRRDVRLVFRAFCERLGQTVATKNHLYHQELRNFSAVVNEVWSDTDLVWRAYCVVLES